MEHVSITFPLKYIDYNMNNLLKNKKEGDCYVKE